MNTGKEMIPLKSEIIVENPLIIEEALKRKDISEGVFIAGGTLLQMHWESGVQLPSTLLSLANIEQLQGIMFNGSGEELELSIGALTTISGCIHHPLVRQWSPLLVEACQSIAAPAVRNRATIGGNVASGLGDTIPALLALDAKIKVAFNNEIHVIKLIDWLKGGESPFILIAIIIPAFKKGTNSFFHKIGRREAFTASLVTVSGVWGIDHEGELEFIRLSVGGGSHSPVRLIGVEQLLVKSKKEFDKSLLFLEILDEFQSYSDPFVTESYRKKVVANILTAELENMLREG